MYIDSHLQLSQLMFTTVNYDYISKVPFTTHRLIKLIGKCYRLFIVIKNTGPQSDRIKQLSYLHTPVLQILIFLYLINILNV